MIYKIADYIVEFKNISYEAEEFLKDYVSYDIPQASFEISNKDIEYEAEMTNRQNTILNSELSAMLRKFSNWVLQENAFLLHSALISVDGEGVAFAARSGTGKTTHMRLWQQLLGEKMIVVNGDKPIVRFFESKKFPIGYGTPWNGKERYGINSNVPIKHICFIERSETNSCEKINPKDVLNLFFNQIFLPVKNPDMLSITLKMVNSFLSRVTVWKIKCNMDISAAEIAYNTIFKENNNEA